MRERESWVVPASNYAKNTFNPIRNIVENLQIVPHPEKPMIALSIGDPTVFGNLKPAEEITEAVVTSIRSGKYNGYGPSTGFVESREAVAKYVSVPGVAELEAKVSQRSMFKVLIDKCECLRNNMLSLFREGKWEVDLACPEGADREQTAAIVVNNPSNPCGSVFSVDHLRKILEVAARNKVPVIADEIYDHFVFEGHEYQPMASLTQEVPVLSCGGLTKRYLIPGWRMGWIAIYDRGNILSKEIRAGLHSLSQRIIGSNTLVQGALPAILASTPKSFFADTLTQIQANAKLCYSSISATPGLRPVMPQGAMYMMVGVDMAYFPDFENDLQFVERMISEESVFCLPGKCFDFPNYVRIVLTVPKEQLQEACNRINSFCVRHYNAPSTAVSSNGVTNGVTNGASNGHANGNGCSNGSSYMMTSVEEAKVLAKATAAALVAEMETD
ncbi:tyrosine aminotransferase-like [Penaeus chinensis]|uniref:tyrosine aminotransferase-like n=1 Tax=Penaeus chinensis TaxID=139456 RepID=UPI001FB65949|nr:tyrosine aminotransferase-like [Penaeus chinensis]